MDHSGSLTFESGYCNTDGCAAEIPGPCLCTELTIPVAFVTTAVGNILKQQLNTSSPVSLPHSAMVPPGPAQSPDSSKGFRLAGFKMARACGPQMWPLVDQYQLFGSNPTPKQRTTLLELYGLLQSCLSEMPARYWTRYEVCL